MASEWRDYVKQEFMKADSEFVEELPVNSIDLSTYGLISEATSFLPVRIDGEVHLRPLPGGLSALRNDIQDSPRPGGGFELDEAIETLTSFAEEWEDRIKEKKKWEKMLELAEEEGQVMDQEEYERESKTKTSFLDKVKSLFK
ncbi:hypothetical protein K9M78_08200 [Candidatus Bipolaricaulota bacterium]|nr:hypothetical protein [Candidatus Bipolaricaulota bacterium]